VWRRTHQARHHCIHKIQQATAQLLLLLLLWRAVIITTTTTAALVHGVTAAVAAAAAAAGVAVAVAVAVVTRAVVTVTPLAVTHPCDGSVTAGDGHWACVIQLVGNVDQKLVRGGARLLVDLHCVKWCDGVCVCEREMV
jgi:tryptophan synthase beta subunit